MVFWVNPGVLFVFNAICYWVIWSFFSLRFGQTRFSRFGLFSLALLPPLWSETHVIWKDTELSIFLFAAYVLITLAKRRNDAGDWLETWVTGGLGTIVFCYCAWVRANSILTLIPLAIFAFYKGVGFRPILRSVGWGITLTGLVYLLGGWINYGLLKAEKQHLSQLIQIHDIAGIYARTLDTTILPGYWFTNPATTPEAIRANYTPRTVDSLAWSGLVPVTLAPGSLLELQNKWSEAIRRAPGAYLQHRWSCFGWILGLHPGGPYNPFHFSIDPNPYGLKDRSDPQVRMILVDYFESAAGTILFDGWFYLGAALFLALWSASRLKWGQLYVESAFFSSVSAFIYLCGYYFYGIGGDFRYLYSTIHLVAFSGAMIFLSTSETSSKLSNYNHVQTEP